MSKYVIAATLLLLLAGCSERQETGAPRQPAPDIAAGKVIATEICSSCHGMDGRGVRDDIPNLAAQLESYLLKAVQTYNHGKRAGGSAMEVTKGLNQEQLRNVVGYYAALPPLGNSAKTLTRYSYYDRGMELSKPCARCHGTDGNPVGSGIPRLAGQYPQYLIRALTTYQEGTRTMPAMHEKLTGLSRADVENIAVYFALNKPKAPTRKVAGSDDAILLSGDCAKCHGASGYSSNPSLPILAGQDLKYLNAMIRAYRDKVREHSVMHRIISGLSDRDIEKIALFFAAEPPAQMTFILPEPVETLAQKCDICHGSGNTNPEMLTPKLKGQNRTYLINALTAYRDSDRGNSAMHRISTVFDFNATIEGIAYHYSEQEAR